MVYVSPTPRGYSHGKKVNSKGRGCLWMVCHHLLDRKQNRQRMALFGRSGVAVGTVNVPFISLMDAIVQDSAK